MEKLILKNGAELIIGEGASISRIPVLLDSYEKLADLAGKLVDNNLQTVKFASGDIITGSYEDMTIMKPHFTVTIQDDGKLQVMFGLREKTKEELQQDDMQIAIAYLSDDQAITVPALYPEWRPAGTYASGDRRNYNGGLYKCLQPHTAQEDWTPVDAPSLWAPLLVPDPDVIPEWAQPDSTNGYSTGDKVTHNGKTWESLIDNNVWEPGITGTESLWKELTE